MAEKDTTEETTVDLTPQPDAIPEPISPEPISIPEAVIPAAASRPEAPRRGGFVGGVMGGLIAAGAGFGVAQYVPDGWPLADTSALSAQLAEQSAEINALKSRVPVPDATLQDRIAALETAPAAAPDLTDFDRRLAALEARVMTIEQTPLAQSTSPAASAAQGAALSALQAEVQALKAAATPAAVQEITAKAEEQLRQAEAAAAQIKTDAEALAKRSETREAVGRLQAALDSGTPYAAILTTLPDLPAVLTDAAESGLPTLAALQDTFPTAARAALEAALRANMGESWSERVTSFLRTQTGARSLEPREGSDPDAILSRAEAALAKGDLPTTLTEIAALPPEAQTALTDWRAAAEKRLAAAQAVADLAATIGE